MRLSDILRGASPLIGLDGGGRTHTNHTLGIPTSIDLFLEGYGNGSLQQSKYEVALNLDRKSVV